MEVMWVERLELVEGAWAWVPKEQKFDLQKDFAMDEGNLTTDICSMGQLLVRYGTLAADQAANLKRKEERVKLVRAQVAGMVRSSAEASGTKMTENKLEEEVTTHPNYQDTLGELHILRADAVRSDHWWRSMVKKADLLNAMAFRQNAEIRRMAG